MSKKNNVLIINSDAIYFDRDSFFIHNSTGEFLLKLKALGYKPLIFHFFLPLNNTSITTFELSSKSILFDGVYRKKNKFISYLSAIVRLLYLIKNSDFVYVFYPNAFSPLLLYCILIRKKYGIYLRGEKNINSIFSNFIYKYSKFITTISPRFTSVVKTKNNNSFTIAPMIEFGLKDIVYESYELKTDFKSILFIGRIEKDKGIFELIEAFKRLIDLGYSKIQLNIIGSGKDTQKIISLINDYDLNGLVTLHGNVSDSSKLKAFYMNSDFFILPTYHEGFPRVLYEAMIFRVTIITTFVGSINDLMIDEYNCFKILPANPNNLVEVMVKIFSNDELIDPILNNATLTVKNYLIENFRSHEDIVNLFLK